LPSGCADNCPQAGQGLIWVAWQNPTVYPKEMMYLRVIFQTFLLALIVAIAANGAAMASTGVMHQDHCAHAASDATKAAPMVMDHENHSAASDDATSAHDHETCMMHACSAVAYEPSEAVVISVLLSVVISSREQQLLALERADGLLRPPNT